MAKAEEVSEESIPSTMVKEIILENFMSYEYARIPLREGLNLIVGPNGAGKSSILLAISVALGQAYTERSRKLSDLIRRGKDIARVSLIFDNRTKDGRRPIPYSKSDTFMLSRYLRKDGSYWYEADYKEIDKTEVVRLLRDFGINPDNLLIIMHQGMIEEFGAISPQQRLLMVEEAVGFRDYREKILSSENDLKGLVSEEGSLGQLIENANQTIEYWKQIYDRYLEKKNLVDHRRLLESELLWSQEAKLTKSLQSIQDKLSGKRRNLEDLMGQQQKAGDESSALHQKLQDKQVELRKLYGALVRAEKERAKDEGAKAAMEAIRGDIEDLLKSVDDSQLRLDQKKMAHLRELTGFSAGKVKREAEDAERRKGELDREISSLQSELGGVEDSIKKVMDDYISQKVRFEVLAYRIKVTESEIRELERSEREVNEELAQLKPQLEKAGERMVTQRQPYEVSEELKLVSAQLQKLQDVPEEAERIYKDYTGNIEGLRTKLKELQENKKSILKELEERKTVWKEAIQKLIDETTPVYQRVLASVDATGMVRMEEGESIEEAGLLLLVGFKGSDASVLDPYTQSGGERSVALMAFILSLQSRIISPIRGLDEFDIHMDPKNREAIFQMILSQARARSQSQHLVITPSILTVIDKAANVITVQSNRTGSEVKQLVRKSR
ncbi:MAG: AAA family ATPase [Thaumarchaeota archaeon]|nr:AAA family ATPase [Nitrososphaerota archaeon]